MNAKLLRIRELINQQEAIEIELASLLEGGTTKERAPQRCSLCGEVGHTARSCKKPEQSAP